MSISQWATMLVTLLGGLGLFLFGMNIMSDGLEKAAGDRMSGIIEKMTGNLFKGVLAGALVTGLIQSSSATTVMVIGFVNAGIMKLAQTVGVIMGANIGTTVTAQLLSLSDISGNAWYLAIIKPANFAPILIAVGVFFIMFSKKKSYYYAGNILTGFGMIFVGMSTMESAVSVLRDMPQFTMMFQTLTNPILGVLAGMAVTAIIQSSSASIGILQAATSTGSVTFASAAPIILGQNIGTCVTAILSSVGASRNAKRAAVIHLAFNVIGTVFFLILLYSLHKFIPFWDSPIYKSGIANFHLVFNIVNTLILLPFSKQLVKLADHIVKDPAQDEEAEEDILDSRFLANPPLAVNQAVKETINMANLAAVNFGICRNAMVNGDLTGELELKDNENKIDQYESKITHYLMKIVDEGLSPMDSKLTSSLFHVLIDIERIGDRCQNLYSIATRCIDDNIQFSASARKELQIMFDAVNEILQLSILCYQERSLERAHQIATYENVVDEMRQRLRMRHMERITKQSCTFDAAIVFLDMAGNLERISDHCANIATSVEQLMSTKPNFDPHKDPKAFMKENPREYALMYRDFEQKYSLEQAHQA